MDSQNINSQPCPPTTHLGSYGIEELLKDHQLYHSEFQQDRFITIKSGGTPYGCYRQALREIHKRHHAVQELELQIAEVEIDLEEIGEKINAPQSTPLAHRRAEIERQRKLLAVNGLKEQLAETQRELDRFHQQAAGLKEVIGELTEERRDQLDREFWEHRVKSMMAVEILVYGKPGTSTVELLQCLPPDMRQRLLLSLDSPEAAKRLTVDFLTEELPENLVASPRAPGPSSITPTPEPESTRGH